MRSITLIDVEPRSASPDCARRAVLAADRTHVYPAGGRFAYRPYIPRGDSSVASCHFRDTVYVSPERFGVPGFPIHPWQRPLRAGEGAHPYTRM